MYESDKLFEYIKHSVLKEFSNTIRVRLSKELAVKYDNGVYKDYLTRTQEQFDKLNSILNITYPANAKPIFYIYIVPDDNFAELLHFQKKYIKKGQTWGGKPVRCYDLDGFTAAYGLSQNILENYSERNTIASIVNDYHELSHIIHHQFFSKNQILGEGFAETIPLYILDLESDFTDYKEMLKTLTIDDILSAEDILKSEKDDTFGRIEVVPNRTCSFRIYYISSYLFVRGYIEELESFYHIEKIQAVQTFLELVRNSEFYNEWLIFALADEINYDKEELLNGKKLQSKILEEIINGDKNVND